jgi:hypothetical protein
MKSQRGEMLTTLLLVIVGFVIAVFLAYRVGYNEGVSDQKAVQVGLEAQYKDNEILLRTNHDKKINNLIKAQHESNLKNTYEHENSLQKLQHDLAVSRAESKRLGGLLVTIPKPTCKGSDIGTGAETASASERDEASTITVALPEQVETDLWSIVGEADAMSLQLNACQSWIKENGFYGEK